jgi:cation:H+ antiporter
MLAIFFTFLILIAAIAVLAYSSHVAVTHSASLAASLGLSSLVMGITLVSIGTDISEILNSVISSALGHGDIDVGDSIGSDLAQLTLIFGILPIICGEFIVNRKSFLIIGACEILSLILIFTVVEKGYFTRLDAIFMILTLIFYTVVTYNVTKSDELTKVDLMMEKNLEKQPKGTKHFLLFAIIGFFGASLSSYLIVQSIIYLSTRFNINEYIISFFMVSIGTSLPELSVNISALKQKNYNLAIGNIIGSCIVDSTLSIGIGQALFPQEVSTSLIIPTIIYTLFASLIVFITIGKREKMDWKSGVLFIGLYTLSFPASMIIYNVLYL